VRGTRRHVIVPGTRQQRAGTGLRNVLTGILRGAHCRVRIGGVYRIGRGWLIGLHMRGVHGLHRWIVAVIRLGSQINTKRKMKNQIGITSDSTIYRGFKITIENA
jgi:hypothetical protein